MPQNDNATSADVDRAFSQLELALSGEVQPDEVTDDLALATAVELALIGGTLLFLQWALKKLTAHLERRGYGS